MSYVEYLVLKLIVGACVVFAINLLHTALTGRSLAEAWRETRRPPEDQ